jgi:hypothetical protein
MNPTRDHSFEIVGAETLECEPNQVRVRPLPVHLRAASSAASMVSFDNLPDRAFW